MKPSHDPLDETLQRWRVTAPANPDFRAAVWQRIWAATETRVSWSAYMHRHAMAWAIAVAVAIGGASYVGHTAARARTAADRETIAVTYLVSLDPRALASHQP